MQRPLDPARVGDHLDRLYRASWALCGSREDAEDLVQETYARVLARPRLLRNDDDLGYLLRALRNTFLNQKRSESRRLRAAPRAPNRFAAGMSQPSVLTVPTSTFSPDDV
jgi:RNA polymerase sigma-70 factor, ECF subfamily